ncbi:MAG: hypothetical protein F6K36_21255 [Symploca sp. SIO3C6]|uniref:Uncharacterized protein n=1 Tax=Symploca sp. SIO1C4 TaxID=2607765 RepID=A0A6B3NH10_9CYAN|nr:hypothetical protein [Symploca sp. SIO3C6]NER30953.1 hypothetical protein [Symploca sp. SIO1C4]NET04318.1 hypothetical protein [Symploca sp. SIO2B6]
MDSKDIAQYIEATDGFAKPWLLVQLRLQKLKERRSTISPEEYAREIEELHIDLMNLGKWWEGREKEVF